jgi:DNA polymerase-3 subunit beta
VKFRVEREVLGEAVAFVARALAARPVVPVLSGLLLQAEPAGLALSCFDYEVSARAQLDAVVTEPGTALIPGRLLADITRSLPSAHVEVSTAAGMVMLTCGSAEFALVSLPLEEYPQLPGQPAATGIVDGALLATAAAQVVPSASRDDTLPMLTGVSLEFEAARLTLAATDRYRLAVRTVAFDPVDAAVQASVLVPARTLAEVARTMGTAGPVTIAFGQTNQQGARPADGMISFDGGGRRLTARLIGADFVKYESRFRVAFDASAELPAGQFIDAVRRVSLVADRTSPVQLAFRRDVAVIEARSDGRARAVESVPVTFAGADQVISFNPQYLLDGLAAAALTGQSRGAAEDNPAADNNPTEDSGATEGSGAAEGHSAAGEGDSAAGEDAVGAKAAAGGHGPPRPGRIRLQFTSPAKPAVISWIDTEPPADPAVAAFRYLVVPLRVPATG